MKKILTVLGVMILSMLMTVKGVQAESVMAEGDVVTKVNEFKKHSPRITIVKGATVTDEQVKEFKDKFGLGDVTVQELNKGSLYGNYTNLPKDEFLNAENDSIVMQMEVKGLLEADERNQVYVVGKQADKLSKGKLANLTDKLNARTDLIVVDTGEKTKAWDFFTGYYQLVKSSENFDNGTHNYGLTNYLIKKQYKLEKLEEEKLAEFTNMDTEMFYQFITQLEYVMAKEKDKTVEGLQQPVKEFMEQSNFKEYFTGEEVQDLIKYYEDEFSTRVVGGKTELDVPSLKHYGTEIKAVESPEVKEDVKDEEGTATTETDKPVEKEKEETKDEKSNKGLLIVIVLSVLGGVIGGALAVIKKK